MCFYLWKLYYLKNININPLNNHFLFSPFFYINQIKYKFIFLFFSQTKPVVVDLLMIKMNFTLNFTSSF